MEHRTAEGLVDGAVKSIEEVVHRETRAWNTKDLDLLLSVFHPDMVWAWPPHKQAHDPLEWVIPWGRYSEERWLGRYFHEDWVLDHRTAEECLDQMLEEAPLQQQREGAAEIARVLSGELCENQIRDLLLYEVGCAYAVEADGYDASSWLRHVHGRLLDSIRRTENGTSGV